MITMKKKGQGAMEYLMTYGWAIIVIALVVAALFALGILNPATYQQKRCSGFQYLTYEDQKLTTTQYVVNVRNGKDAITINSIKVGTGTLDAAPTVTGTTGAGDKFSITTSNAPSGLTAGSAYPSDMTVVVNYDVTGGIAGQSDTASCTGTVQ